MAQQSIETQIVWKPLPGSQQLALDTRAHHTLLHGTRGPGKTAAQLMRYRRFVGLGYGPFWRGIIFDREFKNLDDIVNQSKKFFNLFDDGARWLATSQQYRWVWPSGEELLFRHVKHIDDYDSYHGHEYPFLGWNELTKQPTSELYDKLMSTNRSSFIPELHTPKNKDGTYATPDGKPLPPIPLEVFSTTNPNGPGHHWVKRKFITPAKNGVIVRTETPIFNPQTKKDEIYVKKQVAIFGSYRENPFLDPSYIADLNNIKDPNLRRAWLGGDWDVISGGAFDDLWRTEVHRKPRFKIPSTWFIDRAFDWGSTHPFCVGWWAQANGESVMLEDGSTFTPVRGSLIMFQEWYGAEEVGTNKGLKLGAAAIADGIKERESMLAYDGWITGRVFPGPADNQIRDVRESDVDTIEKKMSDKGVTWTESDKSPGSRRNGMDLFRDMLLAAITGEGKAIYFMANCAATLETVPALPRDPDKPDDVDTTAEDHAYDQLRYRVLRGANRLATNLNMQFPR